MFRCALPVLTVNERLWAQEGERGMLLVVPWRTQLLRCTVGGPSPQTLLTGHHGQGLHRRAHAQLAASMGLDFHAREGTPRAFQGTLGFPGTSGRAQSGILSLLCFGLSHKRVGKQGSKKQDSQYWEQDMSRARRPRGMGSLCCPVMLWSPSHIKPCLCDAGLLRSDPKWSLSCWHNVARLTSEPQFLRP